jgi:outer membrane protein TolC
MMVMKVSRTLRFASLVIAAALVTAATSEAQQLPGVLTLDDALRLARENSPTYAQVLNNAEVDEANERFARSRYWPTPTLELNTGGGPTRSTIGGISEFDRTSDASIALGLSMAVLDNGSRSNQLRAAKLGSLRTNIDVEQAGLTLRTTVAQRYYAAVLAQRAIQLEERTLEKQRGNLAESRDRFRIGRSSQVDLLNAELAVEAAANALERARDALRKRRLELVESMGTSTEIPAMLDSVLPQPVDPKTLAPEALLALARQHNPLIRREDITLDVTGSNTRFTRSSRWRPEVRAGLTYRRFLSNDSLYSAFLRPDLPNSTLNFNITAGYDFPEWFQSSAQVVTAEAALADQQQVIRGRAITVERQVRSQLIDFQAAARDLALAERRVQMTREVVSIAEEQLRAGTIPYFQYQSYLDQAVFAERDALQARLTLITQQLLLEETLGAPLRG